MNIPRENVKNRLRKLLSRMKEKKARALEQSRQRGLLSKWFGKKQNTSSNGGSTIDQTTENNDEDIGEIEKELGFNVLDLTLQTIPEQSRIESSRLSVSNDEEQKFEDPNYNGNRFSNGSAYEYAKIHKKKKRSNQQLFGQGLNNPHVVVMNLDSERGSYLSQQSKSS